MVINRRVFLVYDLNQLWLVVHSATQPTTARLRRISTPLAEGRLYTGDCYHSLPAACQLLCIADYSDTHTRGLQQVQCSDR